MVDFDAIWRRIEAHAGEQFSTKTGLPFTYEVPGNYLRVTRGRRVINRSLSRTNFPNATAQMPTTRPSDIADRQGSAYTWAILMDRRIRSNDW